MPHFVIEYSDDLPETHDMTALCQLVFDTAVASDNFDPPTIKIRALPCRYWRTGTELQSFVHVTIRLMSGRDTPTKSRLTASVLTAMDSHLPNVGSLTVDIKEIDPATYAKRVI